MMYLLTALENWGTATVRPIASAELYDPATGAWTPTGSLTTGPRHGHTVTLLPNGTVLVAGGSDNGELASAEVYNPASGEWTPTGFLNMRRQWHAASMRMAIAVSRFIRRDFLHDSAAASNRPDRNSACASRRCRFMHASLPAPQTQTPKLEELGRLS